MSARSKRSSHSFRPISVKFDELDRVDGSARFGFGDTVALASMSGPVEARLAVEQASKATLELTIRPLHGVPQTESRALASALTALLAPNLLLHHNPRTLVQIVVQSLSPFPTTTKRIAPSQTAALINASTLSLLRAASVPMRTFVCAISVGKHPDTGELFIDPAPEDETKGAGCFAFDGDDRLLWSSWLGTPVSPNEIADIIVFARTAVRDVRTILRRALAGEQDDEEDKMSTE
ncbi:hypothetical protein EXIGLDRAFT_723351 [Exidia glandulosa HHB12029]|uniref:Exoribonuclease phosphorolytic domain-containing protein n=1 Tax=Exidia glandulosa HHB12029 TaxID=1314781 RepID=A0A165EW15_EXIGL|nr:hypothetical protein EXIGLDRAFT_723351 [Exidia glandulosa HHB12029]